MKILYLGYWGANDGLSQSTINPHLVILSGHHLIDKIHYISIERAQVTHFKIPQNPKIQHHPYHSKFRIRMLAKLSDLVLITRLAIRIIKKEKIDLLMCRSSMAGSIGHLVHKKTNTPYTVESFEPHSEYMLALDIWKKSSLSFLLQNFLEKKQVGFATFILPVSNKHTAKLIQKTGVSEKKLITVPCGVDIKNFSFDLGARSMIRSKLSIQDHTVVGIYVGKFGDLYLHDRAFKVLKAAFGYYAKFFLIVLNNQGKDWVQAEFKKFGIPIDRTYISMVPFQDVPAYLSASDFAFSFHKPSEVSYAFSPIKNGEYWANGLPIVSPLNIGDDSEIIEKEQGGITFEEPSTMKWEILDKLLAQRKVNNKSTALAIKYRSLNNTIDAYNKIISSTKKRLNSSKML